MSRNARAPGRRTSGYRRLEFELPAAAEEPLVGALWGAGTLGLECRESATGGLRVIAYFARHGPAAAHAERVARSCPGVELRRHDSLPEEDWLAVYRRRARPFRLGRRLFVDPGEPAVGSRAPAAPEGRRLLRLPARRAFGTGAHATTRLVVEWLEDLDPAGLRVLDVGCGSGVLSFAAALGGARRVTALEIDPVAACIARRNQTLNRLRFALAAGRAACLGPPAVFDLLLVNVLPEALGGDLADLPPLLAAGGRAVFSGLLDERVGEARRRLRRHGFAVLERRRREGWSALLAAAGDAAGEEGC